MAYSLIIITKTKQNKLFMATNSFINFYTKSNMIPFKINNLSLSTCRNNISMNNPIISNDSSFKSNKKENKPKFSIKDKILFKSAFINNYYINDDTLQEEIERHKAIFANVNSKLLNQMISSRSTASDNHILQPSQSVDIIKLPQIKKENKVPTCLSDLIRNIPLNPDKKLSKKIQKLKETSNNGIIEDSNSLLNDVLKPKENTENNLDKNLIQMRQINNIVSKENSFSKDKIFSKQVESNSQLENNLSKRVSFHELGNDDGDLTNITFKRFEKRDSNHKISNSSFHFSSIQCISDELNPKVIKQGQLLYNEISLQCLKQLKNVEKKANHTMKKQIKDCFTSIQNKIVLTHYLFKTGDFIKKEQEQESKPPKKDKKRTVKYKGKGLDNELVKISPKEDNIELSTDNVYMIEDLFKEGMSFNTDIYIPEQMIEHIKKNYLQIDSVYLSDICLDIKREYTTNGPKFKGIKSCLNVNKDSLSPQEIIAKNSMNLVHFQTYILLDSNLSKEIGYKEEEEEKPDRPKRSQRKMTYRTMTLKKDKLHIINKTTFNILKQTDIFVCNREEDEMKRDLITPKQASITELIEDIEYLIKIVFKNKNKEDEIILQSKFNEYIFELLLRYMLKNKVSTLEHYHSRYNHHYDINYCDNQGNTLLIHAVLNESPKVIDYLLCHNANPNIQNKYYNTALHYALINKYYNIADMLLACGANDKILNINNKNAWDCNGIMDE